MKNLTYEDRKKAEAEKVLRKVTHATGNGIRITFPAKPTKGELDFTKALRRSLDGKS